MAPLGDGRTASGLFSNFRTYPQGFAQLLPEEGACVTCFPSRPHCHSERSEESRCRQMLTHLLLNTSGREGAAGCKDEGNRLQAFGFRLVPANALGFISRNCIAVISGLRPLLPLWCLRHHLSPRENVSLGSQVAIAPLRTKSACHPAKAGAQQPVLYLEPLMNTKVRGALLSHRLRGGRWWRQPPKGAAADRRHLYWRRKAPTSPTQWYFITPWAEPSNCL